MYDLPSLGQLSIVTESAIAKNKQLEIQKKVKVEIEEYAKNKLAAESILSLVGEKCLKQAEKGLRFAVITQLAWGNYQDVERKIYRYNVDNLPKEYRIIFRIVLEELKKNNLHPILKNCWDGIDCDGNVCGECEISINW